MHFSSRKTVFHTGHPDSMITEAFRQNKNTYRRWNYKGLRGKEWENERGIYWANVWKGGVGMLERWDKEDWQEATMHKWREKKMKRRTCVEEHANSLMLEAVWSTFRVPLIANIPIRLVTHLWKLVSATEFFLKGNIDFYRIILMFFF